MKTKFGIVGCGFLGNIVADAWKNGLLPDYELVGVTSRTRKPDAEASGMIYNPLAQLLTESEVVFTCLNKNVLLLGQKVLANLRTALGE